MTGAAAGAAAVLLPDGFSGPAASAPASAMPSASPLPAAASADEAAAKAAYLVPGFGGLGCPIDSALSGLKICKREFRLNGGNVH